MKRIKISNFRKIKDNWDLNLAPITFFTGTNNSGKSTVIKALLVLEDYLKSNNHFELNFHGENFLKHKIESYTNAINRDNFQDSQKDIVFEYNNKGFDISITFEPSKNSLKASLKELKLERRNDSSLKIKRISSNKYQLQLDAYFFEQSKSLEKEDEKGKLDMLALYHTTINVIEEDKKDVERLEFEVDGYTRDIQTIELGGENIWTEKFPGQDMDELITQFKSEINKRRKKIFELKQRISDAEKKLKEIQKKRNQIAHKVQDRLVYSPTFSLDEFDISNRRIDKIIRTVLPKYLVENSFNRSKGNKFKNSDESLELDKANKLGDKILSAITFKVKHLSPHRSSQSKLFTHDNRDVDINNLVKEHSEYQTFNDMVVLRFMQHWMSKDYFDIGEDYRITTYESMASKIEILEAGSWINISDKGFGAGQVFSILLVIGLGVFEVLSKGMLETDEEFTILIEEPEANLHPALQSKLTELFFEVYREFGIKFILETHSEYMIRKSQVFVKEMSRDSDSIINIPFEIYYFENEGKPYSMKYRKDGKFTNEFGPGFFDVNSNLAFDIL